MSARPGASRSRSRWRRRARSHLPPRLSRQRGGFAGNVLLVVIASVVALALVELGCRAWMPAPQLRVFESLMAGGDVVGTLRNYRYRWRAPDFEVDVRTNDRGYREDFPFALSDLDVAFMGDSFAFGHGVDAADRYTAIAARALPGRKAASLAYPNGWQPEHYEYYLRKHPELAPRLLVVGLYLGNDLDADVRETAVTFDRDGYVADLAFPGRDVFDGYMIARGVYPPLLAGMARHSCAVRLLLAALGGSAAWRDYLVHRNPGVYPPNLPNTLATELGQFDAFALRALGSLERIQSLVRARGGKLVVVVIPQNFYAGPSGHPHIARENAGRVEEIVRTGGLRAKVLDWCAQATLTCVDPTPILGPDDYFPLDAHWSPAGHRKVGAWLGKLLAEIR